MLKEKKQSHKRDKSKTINDQNKRLRNQRTNEVENLKEQVFNQMENPKRRSDPDGNKPHNGLKQKNQTCP